MPEKIWVNIIGGGLAGCEAAYRLAGYGIPVRLFEMRPSKLTPAHKTGDLGELVCSNSLKSEDIGTAQGVLKAEMRILDSLVLRCARETSVKAGAALAVDRTQFARRMTDSVENLPGLEIVRKEVKEIPAHEPVIVASGPLTSEELSQSIRDLTGEADLHFFDAVAPIVAADSIDYSKVYRASRYGKGDDDYINCPMNEEEYARFYEALLAADSVPMEDADQGLYFSGCMPIEVMGRKGRDTLRFGPMRPVGLAHPDTGQVPCAVVQLRNEDREGTMLGLVGFQTRMRWGDQQKVLRLIPGLENAEFLRLGVMHRNTYLQSPALLHDTLEFRRRPGLFFAGQITGVEGYLESAATGIIAGVNCARRVCGLSPMTLPENTMIGSLLRYISTGGTGSFQPMNANFGILPPLSARIKNKKLRYMELSDRSIRELEQFSEAFVNGIVYPNIE